MRTLLYGNIELNIKEDNTVTFQQDDVLLNLKNTDMMLDTLNIWDKLGYITLEGDTTKLIDVVSGIEIDIIE